MPDLIPIALAAPDLMTALELNIAIQQPTMVWGPPGIGKSQLYAQLARKLDIDLKDVRAMLMNPVDVNGIPHRRLGHEPAMKLHRLTQVLNTDQVDLNEVRSIVLSSSPEEKLQQITKILSEDKQHKFKDWKKLREVVGDAADDYFGESIWARPGILPKVGRGILLFDEINAAGPDVQAALYQPILDRRIGDHLLGLGWTVMAAGNRMSDKGRVQPMPTPLTDRLQHYDMAVSFSAWESWAVDNDIHPLVVAYLQMSMKKDYEEEIIGKGTPRQMVIQRVGMLHYFNPLSGDRSFPTPRSWEKVSHALKEIEDRNLTGTQIELATLAGKVGRDAATELRDFAITFREGLSINAIMLNPDTAKMPSQAAMKCAVAAALARNSSRDNVDRLWEYINRMEDEYQMLYVKHAARLHPEVTATKPITRFMQQHAAEMR